MIPRRRGTREDYKKGERYQSYPRLIGFGSLLEGSTCGIAISGNFVLKRDLSNTLTGAPSSSSESNGVGVIHWRSLSNSLIYPSQTISPSYSDSVVVGVGTTMVGRVGFISGRGLKNEGIVGVGMVDSNSDCLQAIAPARKSGIARAGVQTIAKITTTPPQATYPAPGRGNSTCATGLR